MSISSRNADTNEGDVVTGIARLEVEYGGESGPNESLRFAGGSGHDVEQAFLSGELGAPPGFRHAIRE